jgi:putative membrane protein
MMDGFAVSGFWAALLGSLIYSALMLVVDAALKSVLSR